MVKRISLIVVCTAIAFLAFSFYSESKADKEENEEKEEEVDFQNIPLTSKQLNAIDLKLGEAQKRELDAMLHVNGTLVLRAQNMADVASLMGGVVKSISVKEGQQINKGQVVATIENTEIVFTIRPITAYTTATVLHAAAPPPAALTNWTVTD